MLGLIFRFVSGLVIGVPIAVMAYYVLPYLVANIEFRHIVYVGLTAGTVGALLPSLLLKTIAIGMLWRQI